MTFLHLLSIVLCALLQRHALAFVPMRAASTRSSSMLQMGFFDSLLKNAFANQKVTSDSILLG